MGLAERRDGRRGGADDGFIEPGDGVVRKRDGRVEQTPYMHMSFHPLERRLDTAIWRALFASSARQARQFVVHGWVKVNGKKMIYPGYMLNPGDMFSVDPERVMYATGARKRRKDSPVAQMEMSERIEAREARQKARLEATEDERAAMDAADAEEGDAGAATLESDEEREAMLTKPEDETDAKKAMKNLITRAKRILEDSKRQLSGKRQQELRTFAQSVRKTMSKHGSGKEETSAETIEDLEANLAEIMTKVPADVVPEQSAPPESSSTSAPPANPQASDPSSDQYLARRDAELLHSALERARANPIDVSKPYATPWAPRAYMSAFAFIPRYLEVNQNICSAVYLRHPVARPGLAEAPTPFGAETMGLAFNWYLRRR
jgi:ribosomal protein S4